MEELILMMAAMLPEEKIIDDLMEACSEYKLVPSETSKAKLAFHTTILMSKLSMPKDGLEGYLDAKKEFTAFQKMSDLFNPPKN